MVRLNILALGENIQYLTLRYDLIYRLLKYIHWIEKVLFCFKISDMHFCHKYVFCQCLSCVYWVDHIFLLYYSINVVIYIAFNNKATLLHYHKIMELSKQTHINHRFSPTPNLNRKGSDFTPEVYDLGTWRWERPYGLMSFYLSINL